MRAGVAPSCPPCAFERRCFEAKEGPIASYLYGSFTCSGFLARHDKLSHGATWECRHGWKGDQSQSQSHQDT
ncbi:FAD-linked oxidoreductase ZEB1 [Fusarium oxysporum f. sp. albedinis]|nr:FAD-linked oxidoreductase ZEB1 [Fusarium oxysporum f. sp. albedinis]